MADGKPFRRRLLREAGRLVGNQPGGRNDILALLAWRVRTGRLLPAADGALTYPALAHAPVPLPTRVAAVPDTIIRDQDRDAMRDRCRDNGAFYAAYQIWTDKVAVQGWLRPTLREVEALAHELSIEADQHGYILAPLED